MNAFSCARFRKILPHRAGEATVIAAIVWSVLAPIPLQQAMTNARGDEFAGSSHSAYQGTGNTSAGTQERAQLGQQFSTGGESPSTAAPEATDATSATIRPLASTPFPQAAVAAKLPRLGVNMHPLADAYATWSPAEVLDQAQLLGATVARIDIHWPWIEPNGPGDSGWNTLMIRRLDAFLDEAKRRKIQVLAVVTETPCWASAQPDRACNEGQRGYDWTYPPADPQSFADFISRMARHAGDRIQYWEIWNEPNLGWVWHSPDPAAYTKLLQGAYRAIKSSDSAAVVLAGSLGATDSGPGRIAPEEYLKGMYAAGAKGYFDALSYHPYTGGFPPTYYDPNWPDFSYIHSVPALHEVMKRAGDTSSIWITEVGWTTISRCEMAGGCYSPNLQTSETDQAADITEALNMASGCGYVAAFLPYELFDGGPRDSIQVEDRFGLLNRDLSPKPVALALRHLAQSASLAATSRSSVSRLAIQ